MSVAPCAGDFLLAIRLGGFFFFFTRELYQKVRAGASTNLIGISILRRAKSIEQYFHGRNISQNLPDDKIKFEIRGKACLHKSQLGLVARNLVM